MRRVPNVSTASVFAIVFALVPFSASAAEPESFPYQAVVAVGEAAVHSGPGEEFYATNQLGQGSRVDVYRHDPGGWRMIRPPEKAFSLIPAESAQPLKNGMAEIVVNDVCARIGSSLADEFHVEQIPLRIGMRVKLFPEQHAPEGWIAIKPPRGEYRWVREENLERVDQKPVSSMSVETESAMAADSVGSSADADEPNSLFDSLSELDRQLEGLDEGNPSGWPLEALSVGYLRLKRSQLDLAQAIDARLARIAELKSIRDEYLGVAEAPSEADSSVAVMKVEPRESAPAEVAAMADPVRKAYRRPAEVAEYYPTNINTLPQDSETTAPSAPMADHTGPSIPTPGNLSVDPLAAENSPASLGSPTATMPPPSAGTATDVKSPVASQSRLPNRPQAIPSAEGAAPRRFDAVGYLQRAVDPSPGAPPYVLVSRAGEIVSYLQLPANASVERYIGYPMGVDGAAGRAANLELPVIAVERLTPVRF